MVKTIALGIFIIAMFLTTVSLCADWQDLDDENLRTFQGNVTAVDIGGSSITVQATISAVFPVSLDTLLKKDDIDIKLSDINVGDYVTIEYYHDGSENKIPVKVLSVTVEYEN